MRRSHKVIKLPFTLLNLTQLMAAMMKVMMKMHWDSLEGGHWYFCTKTSSRALHPTKEEETGGDTAGRLTSHTSDTHTHTHPPDSLTRIDRRLQSSDMETGPSYPVTSSRKLRLLKAATAQIKNAKIKAKIIMWQSGLLDCENWLLVRVFVI